MPPGPNEPVDEAEGTVLAPEELDITEDQHVVELDDGRYLISPEDEVDESRVEVPAEGTSDTNPKSLPDSERDADAIHGWLADRLEATDTRYGFDITAIFEGSVVRQELFSNDVIATFENLLVWYAQHVGGDTPAEDVLGILLAESGTPIRLPPDTIEAITEGYGLERGDRVADLHEAVRREGGLRYPPASDVG